MARTGRGRDGVTVFFTADTHFGHGAGRALFGRPFATVAEMDAAMLAGWNERVGPDDEVWHLGDFALRMPTAEMDTLLGALNGRTHLVIGNNDGAETVRLRGWATVTPYPEIEAEGTRHARGHSPFRPMNVIPKGHLALPAP